MKFRGRGGVLEFGPFVLLAALTGSVCARQEDPAFAPSSTQALAGSANVASADMGGAVEELSGNYGPGFTGRRLIDGLIDPPLEITPRGQPEAVPYPLEAVISFYERRAALVDAVVFVPSGKPELGPKVVEVWISPDSPTERFTKVAEKTLDTQSGEQRLSFSPVEARFVKVRVLSGLAPEGLQIAEVRVIEAARRGYVPLFAREPRVKLWKGSPREAAQRGLDWLQHAAPIWNEANGSCFGCHVQSQALMGQAVAEKQGYRVNLRAVRKLDEQLRSWAGSFEVSHATSVFGAMGLAYAADLQGITRDKGLDKAHPDAEVLLQSADNLLRDQEKDGAMPIDHVRPPIVQGQFMTTANALVSIKRAAAHTQDPKYNQAAERGLAWIASHEPETTQDQIFKIIALMHYGTLDQKRLAWSVVETLATEQQADGGWKENAATDGSNAFATGQVLYAFKQAGVSIHGAMFKRGVDFLLRRQITNPKMPEDGSWEAVHTQSDRPSSYAPTMWAVIGLAGSYGEDLTGALQIVKQQGDKPPARNLVIVLDVSGSMNAKLGETTRWKTALDTLTQVVDSLSDDLHVGLRVYGHRYASSSAQTCSDTELVVPVAKLDRQRILTAANRLRPRGETPLIRSVLQAAGDLKKAGPGSVILITDGEESCKGDPVSAAAQIKETGVDVTLNIVGFTLTGQATEAALGALASSTGGRYYSAQDGPQLSRAVMLAALQRLPYDILDASGRIVASGQTSELSRELPPGAYRIRIDALGHVLEEALTIVADETTTIALGVDGNRFVIKRK